MSIGEILAEAREQAGLTVDEVSNRTGIREAVIRGVERDNYEACGGDLYVHGYIRVIAAAVGTDPKPLIEEYDAMPRRPAEAQATAVDEIPPVTGEAPSAEQAPAAGEQARLPAGVERARQPAAGEAQTAVDEIPPVAEEVLSPSAEALPTVEALPTAEEVSTPGVFVPSAPAQTAPARASASTPPPTRVRRRPALTRMPARVKLNRAGWWRRAAWITALAVAVLAVLGTGGHAILSSLNHNKGVTVAATTDPGVTRHASKPSAAPSKTSGGAADPSRHATSGHAPAHPAHARAHHAPPHAAPAQVLAPVSAEAFGPDGAADGDNPQSAVNVIDRDRGAPWETDWYTTAAFGDLKEGTGLLVDLGRRVTITSAEVMLGGIRGADFQLRAGDSPVLSLVRPVAGASGAGGATWLRLASPVRARYVLIWFTRLPPDTSGTYQASVYGIRLAGQP